MNNMIVELKPSYSCNQNCPYCCFRSYSSLNMKDEEVMNNLIYIKQNFAEPNVFILSGGEPTMHNSFWNILDYIKNEIRPKELVVHSNGTAFTDQRNVMRLKCFSLTLMLSFHTLDSRFYTKYISRKHTLDQLKDAIINLKNNDINLHVNTLIFRDNSRYLKDIADFLGDSVRQLEFRLPFSLSNEIDTDPFMFDDPEIVLDQLYNTCKKYGSSKITFHPSLLCLLTQLLGKNKRINYLIQFCQGSPIENHLSYVFFDKTYQSKQCIISNTQVSAVMPRYSDYFYSMDQCEICSRKSICLGLPIEFRDIISRRNHIDPFIY